MRAFHLLSLILVAVASLVTTRAQEAVVTLLSPAGAAVDFTPGEAGWRWTRLRVPGGPEDGWVIAEEEREVATAGAAETLGRGWVLVEEAPDRIVLEQAGEGTGLNLRRVFSFGPATNVLRVETWARSPAGPALVSRLGLLQAQVAGESFEETGPPPASFPVFGRSLFFGIEHVSGEATVGGDAADIVRLEQRPRLAVGDAWTLVAAVVVGWPQPGVGTGLGGKARLREAFLHYLDSVRIKPERIVLHTDTWWSVPRPLNENKVLADIDALRKAFFERTGMFFDTYCVDLGWSHPRTLWRVDGGRFPDELRPIRERLGALGARLGLWYSPGGGYPEGLDNGWLQAQGYETLPFAGALGQVPCFALGTRYQREFRERVVEHARQHELGHIILDFMPYRCDVAAHGHPVGPESRYAIDAGLADVLDSVRAVNPQMAIEPMVCGYPPSPWWLLKTPFVLGPAGDDLPYGRGPCPDWIESLITARDAVYRASQESWIMPTQALETFDITKLTPGEFRNMAVMAIGRGRWFLSTYFSTEQMAPEDWDFLAALVRWARENRRWLVNAWQIGGRPENREAYGYMFRNPERDIFCVRNPWIEERTIELPGPSAATGECEVRMIYPRRQVVGRVEPGGAGPLLRLAPYETALLEIAPVSGADVAPEAASPEGSFSAAPRRLADPVGASAQDTGGMRYHWSGNLVVPEVQDPELWVLVEGGPEVSRSTCRVTINGREVKAGKATSAGQFGAATEASPENWSWFLVPVPRGGAGLEIELTVLAEQAQVGLYLRGTVAAEHGPAPEDGTAVFPTQRAERRAWSQTLQPLRSFPLAD